VTTTRLAFVRRLNLEAVGLVALAAVYLLTTLPSLGNDPLAGGDEGWIISASAKLADEGVFGSDLFAGFYGSDEHYYFNLPLHHLVLAAWFKVAGVSLASARLLSVAYGLAALLLTYVLSRKVGGLWVGLGAAALLVLLRLNLTPFTGLTLTDLGATVRYDLVTVPYGLGAALLLLMRRTEPPLERAEWQPFDPPSRDEAEPRLLFVALAGLLLGLAAMTQFVGAMFGPPLAAYLLTLRHVALPRRFLLAGVLTVAAIVPFVPYAAYIAQDVDDFRGQARAVEQSTDFLSPGFYVEQLKREPSRFQDAVGLDHLPSSPSDLVTRPSARIALLLLAPLAAAWAVFRARTSDPHRMLALLLFGLVLQLALFESTKRFVYWVIVVPFLCIAVADLAFAAWRRAMERRVAAGREWQLRAVLFALVAVGAVFAAEGLAVAAKDVRDARNAGDYAALRAKIQAAVPPGAVTMGDNRLWVAMRDRPFRSLHLLFYETNPRISHGNATDIPGAFERSGVEYLLLSPLSRDQLRLLAPRDAADFERYVETRMQLVTTVQDATYGPIDVYRRAGAR
jgi:4-amino-4-deoxy-L-arabinose transferase-like glycosyltransferase